MKTVRKPIQHRNQCRFCGTSWTGTNRNTDCGKMDKFHKDARWEEASPK